MFIDESLLTNREGARSKQNLEKGLVYLDPLMKPSSQIALKLPMIRPQRQMNLKYRPRLRIKSLVLGQQTTLSPALASVDLDLSLDPPPRRSALRTPQRGKPDTFQELNRHARRHYQRG